MPKVSIIILNFNGWPETEACLRSLEKVDYPNFEVILIDNASEKPPPLYSVIPGSRAGRVTRNLKVVQIYNNCNIGFVEGCNQGMKTALKENADYILLLNNDTQVEPDFLAKLIAAGEKNKEYGILGPLVFDYKRRDKIQFAGGKVNWSRTKGEHLSIINASQPLLNLRGGAPASLLRSGRGELYPTDYTTGCCLLIKREVVEKIGLMSNDYFLYYEDTDWCWRARQEGWLCGLVPTAKIYHYGAKSTQEFSYPYIYYHTRNGLIFGSRYGFKPLICFISGWIYLKQLIKLVIGYKREWARPVMHGVRDFWREKTGKLEGYY